MKRRIILWLTTLAALLAAFGVYYYVAGLEGLGGRGPERPHRPRPRGRVAPGQGASINDVDDVCIIARDDDGRLEGVYRARKWNRRDDGSHLLIDPRVELYHKSGQRTIIRADRGEVYGQQLDRGVNVRRATLDGNVAIYFDTSTEPDRTPVEDRPDEVVRVHVDRVEFDNERLTVRTDGRVAVFSPEADVYGRGLSISWNESPRELRTLRIDHGQYMAVYNVPQELDVISLPGGRERPTEPGPAAAPGATTAPASRPASPPASGPASAPASRPAEPGGRIVDVAFAAPREPNAPSQPATAEATTKPVAQNQYLAEFHEAVRVVHRGRRLYGADTLAIRFDWDPAWREAAPKFGARRRRRRTRPASRPATAPATAPTSAPGTGPATAPASRPTTAPATQPGEPPDEPMEIFWTGPLVIRPVGHTPTPSRRRYELAASGDQVVLTDPRATAACREFGFRYPQRQGHLAGAPDRPARLLLAEGADVACRTIRFEPDRGRAYLDGAGYMARRFDEGLAQARAVELVETEEPNRLPAAERITWDDHVEIAFTQEKATRRDGTTRTRQFIDQADFYGQVHLQQSEDPNGDAVRCDRLRVHMARGVRVAAYPQRAVAMGNVRARQEGSDIRADRITVGFREAEPNRPGDRQIARGIEPASVAADGSVRISDRRDANADPLVAVAESLTSDLIERTAVLRGQPARIEQGPNHLAGKVIRLDQREQSAAVDGAGFLGFLTRRGLSGRRLSDPRPVRIAWKDAMTFRGVRSTAGFRGGVTLDSGMDHMSCQEMQILFTERPAASQPAASRPADERPRRRRMGVEVERYSRRKISMILADRDVIMRSRRENPKKQILRRMQLAGEKFIYDVENRRITMLGYGTFMAEDYGRPKRREAAGADGMGEALDRPSQSAFKWGKSMQFSQLDRLVVLEGETVLVHRSGQQIVLTDKLPVPRDLWGELPVGRRTRLGCESMMAKFGKAPKPSETRPADELEAGPDFGPLELFGATRDVNLRDGPRQVIGQRLIYDRIKDLAIVWGFLEGQPVADASLIHEDPKTGRSQTIAGPKIVWYRQNNRVVTDRLTGTGSR